MSILDFLSKKMKKISSEVDSFSNSIEEFSFHQGIDNLQILEKIVRSCGSEEEYELYVHHSNIASINNIKDIEDYLEKCNKDRFNSFIISSLIRTVIFAKVQRVTDKRGSYPLATIFDDIMSWVSIISILPADIKYKNIIEPLAKEDIVLRYVFKIICNSPEKCPQLISS